MAFRDHLRPELPAMIIRRPYRNHALVNIEEEALLEIVPEYGREVFRRPYDAQVTIVQFAGDSPELWPTTRFDPLREEDIIDVYYWIIRTISRSSHSELGTVISEHVLEGLEECIRHDRATGSEAHQSLYYRRTQRLFRALADVSHRTRSLHIGTVLVRFFMSHATQIATYDSYEALGQWCFAILRTHVEEVEQFECLRRVLRERPELPTRLIGRGRKAEEVLERLELIAARSTSRRDLPDRSLDLLSLDYERYASRSRSSSRDRPFLLRSHSLRDEFGLRRRESAEDSLSLLRLARQDVVKQRQRQRQVLQLTMGRRYADRFDGRDRIGLGALAFGRDLDLLEYDEFGI